MGKTATNLSIVLGLIAIAFAGYYMYTQKDASSLDFTTDQVTMENMLSNTRVFIERRQILDGVRLDVAFFENSKFRSLHSFSTPILERPIGRANPFAETLVTDTGGVTGI